MAFIPFIPAAAAAVGGIFAADKSGAAGQVGEAAKDLSRVGRNNGDFQVAGSDASYDSGYGGIQTPQLGLGSAQALKAGQGAMGAWGNQLGTSSDAQDWALGELTGSRGPQAWENQALADQEASARGLDQMGALQLQREAAMGLAPSAAAYQMQSGLDQALANQQALAGGARGQAALALAQGNMAGNAANLQQQAYLNAGQLRAQEMANARAGYGDLSSQVRSQDQALLNQANQMSQFNANLNDQWRLGMGNVAQGYGNLMNNQTQNQQGIGQGYFNTAAGLAEKQAALQGQTNSLNSQNYNATQGVFANKQQANAQQAEQAKQDWLGLAGTVASSASSAAPGKPG